MNLRSRQVQKTIHLLKQTGHLVIVRKPGDIDGIPYSQVQSEVDRLLDQMKGEQG